MRKLSGAAAIVELQRGDNGAAVRAGVDVVLELLLVVLLDKAQRRHRRLRRGRRCLPGR